MAKKKYETPKQGTNVTEPPKMPETALVNPAAAKVGLDPNLPTNIVNTTQAPIVSPTPTPVNPNLYKGVDITKSFSNTDFATPTDYEQAKRRAELQVNPDEFHVQQMQQQAAAQSSAQGERIMQQNPMQIQQQQMPGQAQDGSLLGSAVMAGAGKVVTSGPLVGSVIGGAIGTAIAPGVGTAIGAAVGAFISGMATKIRSERNEVIAVDYKTVQYSMKSMNQLITYVNKGGGDREGAWTQFQYNLEAINQAQANLKKESQNNLNKFLAVDTSKEMGNIETFNELLRPIYIQRMQLAMVKPDPNSPTDYIDMTDIPTSTDNYSDLGI